MFVLIMSAFLVNFRDVVNWVKNATLLHIRLHEISFLK